MKTKTQEENFNESDMEYLDSIRNPKSGMYYDLTIHKKVVKGIKGKTIVYNNNEE